jgi:hypothetical protein
MKRIYLNLLCSLLAVNCYCQKIVFNTDCKSLADIDNNNWNYGIEFKKGDTATLVGASKIDNNYYKVKSFGKTVFVYFSSVTEADEYFEINRLKMDSLKLTTVKKQIRTLKKGDTVKILNASPGSMGVPNIKITNGLEEIETSFDNLNRRPGLDALVNSMIDANIKKQAEIDRKNLEERNKKLKTKYGESTFNRLMRGEVWIGMSEELFVLIKGKPDDLNRTVTASRTTEQWIYGLDKYYYFENGKLTSWQDTSK